MLSSSRHAEGGAPLLPWLDIVRQRQACELGRDRSLSEGAEPGRGTATLVGSAACGRRRRRRYEVSRVLVGQQEQLQARAMRQVGVEIGGRCAGIGWRCAGIGGRCAMIGGRCAELGGGDGEAVEVVEEVREGRLVEGVAGDLVRMRVRVRLGLGLRAAVLASGCGAGFGLRCWLRVAVLARVKVGVMVTSVEVQSQPRRSLYCGAP